jgi:hypothetical protein
MGSGIEFGKLKRATSVAQSGSTPFEARALILGQFFANFSDEAEWTDFFAHNNLGLPLAFAVTEEIVAHTPTLEVMVNETWALFMEELGITDTGFNSIQDLMS